MESLDRLDFEKREYQKKMDAWGWEYPFPASVMDGVKLSEEEASRLVALGEERRANNTTQAS